VRIFGFDIQRGERELATAKPAEGTAGKDGDSWYTDVLTGGPDVNPALSGRAKYQAYDEMRKSDASVRSALWMVKLPIRSAVWAIEPAGGEHATPEDRLVADAVAWQLGLPDSEGRTRDDQLDLSFDELMSQALLCLDFGAMFEELIWDDAKAWRDADGDDHLLRPLARLAPRFPSSVQKIETDARTGRIRSLEQILPGARPIPGEKLSSIVLEREGVNWWGNALLRPMWGPWKLKKGLMVAAGIGWDRFASGLPVVRYPAGGSASDKRTAEEIGRNIRQHERGYVALEGPRPLAENAGAGWDVELLSGAHTLADPVPLLRWYSGQIAAAAVQQFSELGNTGQGNRALGETLVDPFFLAVQAVARQIARDRMRQVIRRFVDVNFGVEYDVPQLTVSKIQARNIALLSQAIGSLSAAGLNFTDRETQDDLRDVLDLRHLPENVGIERTPPAVPREGDGLQPDEADGDDDPDDEAA
jgi:hypothetical protein